MIVPGKRQETLAVVGLGGYLVGAECEPGEHKHNRQPRPACRCAPQADPPFSATRLPCSLLPFRGLEGIRFLSGGLKGNMDDAFVIVFDRLKYAPSGVEPGQRLRGGVDIVI